MSTNDRVFIKITDIKPGDVEYVDELLRNWKNYFRPKQYLLPNTEIVECGGSDKKIKET